MRQYSKLLLALALAVTFALSSSVAAEDMTIVSTVSASKGAPRTSTQYFTDTKVRTADGSADTIYDTVAGKMVFIDHNKKVYWETSLEEIAGAFAELRTLLEQNPILEKMLPGDAEVTVTKTGQSREIAGYACNEYVVAMGQTFVFRLWSAPGLRVSAQANQARKAFYATMGPMAGRIEKLIDKMQEVEGFPLETHFKTKIMGMDFETNSVATEVRLGPVPANAFDPPTGYKQKKSPYARK